MGIKRAISFAIVASLVAMPLAGSAQIRDTYLNELLNRREISMGDAAAAVVVSEFLGMNTRSLFESPDLLNRGRGGSTTGTSPWDLGPAWWIQRNSNRTVDEIMRLRRQGRGWGRIAQDIGMHPSELNRWRREGFDQWFWREGLLGSNRLDQRRWDWAVREGATVEEIVIAAVLSPNRDWRRFENLIRDRRNPNGELNRARSPISRDSGNSPVRRGGGPPPGRGQGQGRGQGRG